MRSSILVVDDETAYLDSVRRLLLSQGNYDVVCLNSGVKAVELIETQEFDIALVDVMMPCMDGIEACRRIKRIRPSCAVIVMTGLDDDEPLRQSFEAGACDYIRKPVNRVELFARVGNAARLVAAERELVRRNNELAKANANTRQLLHVLCHDLSNPLCSIANLMEMHSTPGFLDEFGSLIINAAQNGVEIIQIVRKTLAIQDGKLALNIQSVPLRLLIERVVQIVNLTAADKNVRLEIDVDPCLMVMAEPVSFASSVMTNLLTNAVKFSYPGNAIQIRAWIDDETHAVLEVVDHGIGIPQSILTDLFELSKATHRPGTNGEPGTGYGMPLAKRFVEAYEGTLEIHSKEAAESPGEHGTTAVIRLRLPKPQQ